MAEFLALKLEPVGRRSTEKTPLPKTQLLLHHCDSSPLPSFWQTQGWGIRRPVCYRQSRPKISVLSLSWPSIKCSESECKATTRNCSAQARQKWPSRSSSRHDLEQRGLGESVWLGAGDLPI